MSNIYYDIDGNIIEIHDTEDKGHWCLEGENNEIAFLRMFGEKYFFILNPPKRVDKYAPDLLSQTNNKITDLKAQGIPFFKAEILYGIDPTYAVTFNIKDKLRYEKYYPEIDILYYVNWRAVKVNMNGSIYTVEPHEGIYRIPFSELLTLLRKAPIHNYQRRQNDQQGNARKSYVFDIRNAGIKKLM